jgi:hypothetical protein
VPLSGWKISIEVTEVNAAARDFKYAIERPSGDQTGESRSSVSETESNLFCPPPSARVSHISCPELP